VKISEIFFLPLLYSMCDVSFQTRISVDFVGFHHRSSRTAGVTEDFDQKICKAECVAPKNKLSNKTFLELFKPIFLQETDV
jgi:hypothetical protein